MTVQELKIQIEMSKQLIAKQKQLLERQIRLLEDLERQKQAAANVIERSGS